MSRKYAGSSFEEFLEEDGRLEESTSIAMKRVVTWQRQSGIPDALDRTGKSQEFQKHSLSPSGRGKG